MQDFNTFCSSNGFGKDTTSNYDLIDYAKQLKIKYFRGCFMNDELPKKIEQMNVL